MSLGFEVGNIQNDIKKLCFKAMGCLWTCLLQWEFAPSFLIGMSEMGLLVVTLCNLTAVVKNGLFYLDIFCCCIP